MNVFFLHSGDRVPSSRFRAIPVARRLRSTGHPCVLASSFPQKYDYFPWLGFRPSQLLKQLVRWGHLFRARLGRFDVVAIDRELFDSPSLAMERRFREAGPALVLELDDGVFLRYPEKFAALIPLADHVIVGNRFLAEYVQRFHDRWTEIPTCIELDDYPPRNPDQGNPVPVIGWMGTTSNLPYLRVLAPALTRLVEHQAFVLRVVAPEAAEWSDLGLQQVEIDFCPWRGASEVAQLQAFDIGVMPLPQDEEWTRYKCGLKLLQYMAVGLPAVASPVGINAEIVHDGSNGFLADSPEAWLPPLKRLVADATLRRRVGAEGRRTVEQAYSVEVNLPRYLSAFEQAIEHRAQN